MTESHTTRAMFTTTQIARALGRTRQAVQKALLGVAPCGAVANNGGPAAAWSLARLPQKLRQQLNDISERCGYRDVESLLSMSGRWEPAVPLAKCGERSISRANNLQRALVRSLERQARWVGTVAEFEARGLEDWRAVYGEACSVQWFRKMLTRTKDRDRGQCAWNRLELYLDERPQRIVADKSPKADVQYKELCDVIAGFKNPDRPTNDDKRHLWLHVFEQFECEVAEGRREKKSKLSLLKFIEARAEFLGSSANARRVAFNRNYAKWVQGGRTPVVLDDARANNSGRRRAPVLSEGDRKLLISTGAKHGGGIEAAWRERFSELSPAIQSYYATSRTCPRAIRQVINNDVKLEKISLHGPNAVKSAGAFVDRDPDGIDSGDRDQSDDMTFVNLMWEDAPDGLWWGQPQFLAWLDERSWFIYNYDLISDSIYSGFSIRNSWTVKALDWGLPRKGLTVERGPWKTSHVLVGRYSSVSKIRYRADEIDPAETEKGIRRLPAIGRDNPDQGLDFQHPTHARGKIIEGVYGLLQNRLQMFPGYVGRNPLTDRYEKVQKQMRLVRSGKAHPSEFWLSKSEWLEALDEAITRFNDTSLNGKYHNGLTPKEAYEKHFTTPLIKVPDECRHLVGCNKIEVTIPIRGNGISFRYGKQQFRYKNHMTGRLRGERIIAWFNAARPETLSCTDMEGKNPFVVSRATMPFNHDPLPGTLEKALAENAEHNRYQKELHRSLKPYYNDAFFKTMFRPTLVSEETLEVASEFKRQETALKTEIADERERARTVRRLSEKHNIPLTPAAARDSKAVTSAKRLAELLAEQKAKTDEVIE